jgi:hypothetical protein
MRSEMIEQRISGLFSLFGPSSQKEIYLSSLLTNGVTYPLARSRLQVFSITEKGSSSH